MTIRDLQILFQRETGKYPPFLSRQDRTIKYKHTASEEEYIAWLHEQLTKLYDNQFKRPPLPDFWFEFLGK